MESRYLTLGEQRYFEKPIFTFINVEVLSGAQKKKGRTWGRQFTHFETAPSTVPGEFHMKCCCKTVATAIAAESVQEGLDIPESHREKSII